MVNPSKRDSAAKRVVACARSIVTYQVGLPVGCIRITRTLTWFAPFEAELPKIFERYLSELTGLPIGSERLLWDRITLKEKDVLLEATSQRYRDDIFDACWELIDRFAEPDLSSSTI